MTSKPSIKTDVGGMDIAAKRGPGVALEFVHWEHYCKRIDALEMPTMDQANFYVGSVCTFISTGVAFVGILWGTDNPSPLLVALLGIGCLAAAAMSWYFKRAYDRAKVNFTQPARLIAVQMREVAAHQKKMLEGTEGVS